MKRTFQIIAILLFLVFSGKAYSHSPDEVTYYFDLHDEAVLKIHLTPKAAIDLLKMIHPELKDATSFRLADYYDDFTAYFNKTVQFKSNNKNVTFLFLEANLTAHDAFMVFKVDSMAESVKNCEVMVSSFTELYSRLQNFVKIKYAGKIHRVILNSNKLEHQFFFENQMKNKSNLIGVLILLFGFFTLFVVYFLTGRHQNYILNKRVITNMLLSQNCFKSNN